jgi:UDP-glucuronate 4-epimerase
MHILITGAAGFIGFHLSQALLARGDTVTGIDNLNDYYDVKLKKDRLSQLRSHDQFHFYQHDIADALAINAVFDDNAFDAVVNLAAQAGVRYSLENPRAYIDANIVGFLNILEACRHHKIANLVYASSSSVYGANTDFPFKEQQNVDHPLSLYAASKKSNELMAHTYSHLYGLPTTGLRFFTVYGPWGRPDMALFLFTRAILAGEKIDVYNQGDMLRDFTFIDDIIKGIMATIDKPATPNTAWSSDTPDPASSNAPYRIYNIGNGSPVKLLDFIDAIECSTGKTAHKHFMPLQPGDVPATYADTSALQAEHGVKPGTDIKYGVNEFVKWFMSYYQIEQGSEAHVDTHS